MFYAARKRHTGGWCGPGQRSTTSVVSPAYGSLVRSADGSPAVLAPAPCPADQGPGVGRGARSEDLGVRNFVRSELPDPNSSLPRPACFEVDPTGATQALFARKNEHAPVFQLSRVPTSAPNAHSLGEASLCQPLVSTWENVNPNPIPRVHQAAHAKAPFLLLESGEGRGLGDG